MPIPKAVGRWNKAGLNRLTRHIAPWMPGLGVVVHRGRRSGRRYQTPVNVFPAGSGCLVAVMYGPDTDWVKNVLAAGSCELRTRGPGHSAGLAAPVPRRQPLRHRSPERQVLRILGVADFLSLTPASASTAALASPTQDRAKTNNERIAVKVAIGLAAQPRSVQMLHRRLDRAAVRWDCGLLSPLVRITRGSGCHGEPQLEQTRQNGTGSESLGITVAANLAAAARTPAMQVTAGPAGPFAWEAVSDGGSHDMGEVAYRSKVSIEREKGPLRWARLPAEPDPIVFGVHSEVARHYGVTPEASPPHATTLDYLVAAAAG